MWRATCPLRGTLKHPLLLASHGRAVHFQPLLHSHSALSLHPRCWRVPSKPSTFRELSATRKFSSLFASSRARLHSRFHLARTSRSNRNQNKDRRTLADLFPSLRFLAPILASKFYYNLASLRFAQTRGPQTLLHSLPIVLVPLSTISHSDNVLVSICSFLYRSVRLLLRVCTLAIIFLPLVVFAPFWFIIAPPSHLRLKNISSAQKSWLYLLVQTLELAGPTFIKLGQWASSRTDVFPNYVCEVLTKLHSDVGAHSMRDTKKTVEKAFGKSFNVVFEHIDSDPIGVGAIAQVYYARLFSESGTGSEPVAVKVLHPHVRSHIKMDLQILYVLASVLEHIPYFKWVSPMDELLAFQGMMQNQLDLVVESNNLLLFHQNFEYRPYVSFPKPILAHSEVLVEAFEEGVPMTLFLKHGPSELDHHLAKMGLDAFLRMLITDNFTHADLHPGNIYVTFIIPPSLFDRVLNYLHIKPLKKSANRVTHDVIQELRNAPSSESFNAIISSISSQGYEPRLIFLDTGLVSSLSSTNQRNFLDLFHAVASFNGRDAAQLLMERSKTPWTVIDPEEFQAKFEKTMSKVKNKTLTLSKIKISDILGEALDLVRAHHVKLEGEFINVVIGILLLEGMGRRLDPDLDLLKSALPVLVGGGAFGIDGVVLRGWLWSTFGKSLVKAWKGLRRQEYL